MAQLSYLEKDSINRLFNQSGYVLHFSTSEFDRFTFDSIGIPLCEHYKFSKGKSLNSFIDGGDNLAVAKLLEDLLNYYAVKYEDKVKENQKAVDACWEAVRRLYGGKAFSQIAKRSERLIDVFNSDYIAAQIRQMNEAIEKHPADAIGKAKELLESCCHTILAGKTISVNKDWSVQQLVKNTCKELKLTPDDIPDTAKASDTIKQILGNLSAISAGMAELRNSYGTGHGKSSTYKGLSPRHARLAVGASTTTVFFLWETYEEQKPLII
ncbi:abortive infection family protein [Paenibacillus sp. NPDC058177]|uniref:abortive infection family protein n=1 Tax=Paenibacillus sp. NPDC058177 TaxID=3346369 RepID=UPI0036DE0D43